MNPWANVASAPNDLSALVARALELGSQCRATPLVPAAAAGFLGVAAPRVAMALVCGATTDVGVRAFHDHDGWVLSGDAGAIPWGSTAATFLIAARTESPSSSTAPLGLFVVDASAPGVIRTARPSIGADLLSHVHLAGVRIDDSARHDDAGRVPWSSVVAALDKATIVAAAELAGLARGALAAAIAYASTREQFGAPIATYQALAHRLADMAIDTESAELAVEESAGAPTAPNASRAKIIANDAAHRVTAALHQINGGVGFYLDQVPPAYYARVLALRVEMGDSAIHRLRLAYPAAGL
ncbi:MAG: acyl-CoA dehydrogenase family protein [Acidimicrobiales bacterium]